MMENIENLPKKLEAKVGKEGAVFPSDGNWYLASYVSEPKNSMIEAINSAMGGGITFYEMTYMFQRHGVSLGVCFEQDPEKTVDYLNKKFEKEFESLKQFPEAQEICEKLRTSLIYLKEREIYPNQEDLNRTLSIMVDRCDAYLKSEIK